jgi:hypothetical protein
MKTPRRHHVVPKLHLRGFADDREQVRVVTRDDLTKSYCASISDATVQRDFYALETDAGPSHVLETEVLAKAEGECKAPLSRLLGGTFPPTMQDRLLLAKFIALQWVRSENQTERISALLEGLAKLVTVNATPHTVRQAVLETQGREPTKEEITDWVAFLSDPAKYEIKVHRNRVLQATFELTADVMQHLMHRQWCVLHGTGARFLTSDAPVVLWSRPEQRVYGVGIATAEEILFPLDREHALCLWYPFASVAKPEPNVQRQATPEIVRWINGRVANNARRCVIHHPADHPLDGLDLPPRVQVEPVRPFRIAPPG